ncbi:TIGR02922 family protein [Thalassotalea psychrophila]|uniref:TIGR02922 family protein n=1 Tax=Thalassotalea psychrophila TaxID=3065647 RepID=A0ABY9TWI1_9GAMM|nr:TIGR02922 family protein [Colwelliaceae bacterium SQ149]
MNQQSSKTVTVIFYDNNSLELQHQVGNFPYNQNGRVIIPTEFKKAKSIIAVCEGVVNVLNKIGERILPLENVA